MVQIVCTVAQTVVHWPAVWQARGSKFLTRLVMEDSVYLATAMRIFQRISAIFCGVFSISFISPEGSAKLRWAQRTELLQKFGAFSLTESALRELNQSRGARTNVFRGSRISMASVHS